VVNGLGEKNRAINASITMSYVEISSDEQFNRITNEADPSKLLVIYFQTEWAEPCHHMNTVFQSLAEVYPQHQFISIDADKFPDISEMLSVSAVPFFVLLKNKMIVKELSGADPRALARAIQEVGGEAGPTANGSGNSTPGNEMAEESKEELETRLKKLMSAAPVMLFMKGTPAEPKCGFSRQLVGILRENQVRFGFFDILKDNAVRQGLKEFSEWPTYPQLYINGELQGGLDILKESLEEDPNFFDAVK